jgi:hypothetical protein
VEISLYPLLRALEREGSGPHAEAIRNRCASLLKEDATLEALLAKADSYLSSPALAQFRDLDAWPHHNTAEQAELMLTSATELLEMNRDPKEIVCAELSRAVFSAVGSLMFRSIWNPVSPVLWLNHDIIARQIVSEGNNLSEAPTSTAFRVKRCHTVISARREIRFRWRRPPGTRTSW